MSYKLLAENWKIVTNPAIYLNLYEEHERSGVDLKFRIKAVLSASTYASDISMGIYSEVKGLDSFGEYIFNENFSEEKNLKTGATWVKTTTYFPSSDTWYTTNILDNTTNKYVEIIDGQIGCSFNVYIGEDRIREFYYADINTCTATASTLLMPTGVTNIDIDSGITFNYNRYNSNYVDKLQIWWGNRRTPMFSLVERRISEELEHGNTYTLDFTYQERLEIYSIMRQTNSMPLLITLFCWNTGETQLIGQKDLTATAIITNANPTLNSWNYTINNSQGALIPNYSDISINFNTALNASAHKGAELASVVIDGTAYPYSDNVIDNVFSCVKENYSLPNITIKLVDSRGNYVEDTKTHTPTITSYAEPSIEEGYSIAREGGSSEITSLSLSGTYWNGDFNTGNANNIRVSYKYKILNSTGDYINGNSYVGVIYNESEYSISANIIGDTDAGFDIDNSYEIVVTATDKIGSKKSFTVILNSGIPALKIRGNQISFANFSTDITDIIDFTGEADTQQYFSIGGFLIVFGRTLVNPTANTASSETVTFTKSFNAPPFVITGLNTSVIGTTIKGASASTITSENMKVYVYRTNTTVTSVYWIAIGQEAIT